MKYAFTVLIEFLAGPFTNINTDIHTFLDYNEIFGAGIV